MATTWTDGDPVAFVERAAPAVRRRDAHTLLELMRRVTGQEPRMFGTSMVGFGQYRYEYASGRSGQAPAASFAPRKAATTVYLPDGVGAHEELLARLGPHTTGVGCLYVKDLEQVDLGVLEEIVRRSWSTVTAGTFGRRARES
ncbi:DUF1801 domain-containing protein [Promicromonospora sp. NPDC050880]|uniref:DUF1801 domain-containing protein n=1 Tax=Promicromonospora sp. NPDC050880 TaxID=3364406 RepID=UPI0037A430C8